VAREKGHGVQERNTQEAGRESVQSSECGNEELEGGGLGG
jgi:hypothetical protein